MLFHIGAEMIPSAVEESTVMIRNAADLVVHATYIAIATVIGVTGIVGSLPLGIALALGRQSPMPAARPARQQDSRRCERER